MLQIENLTYRYNRKKVLFNGLNLSLLPGKVYGLLGKNGAGKSSLIKNMAGLLFPSKGKCLIDNWEPRKRETAFLEQLFFIPEECELPRLSVPDFIELYAAFYPAFNKEQFMDYLKIFNVSQDGQLQRLSFGQKKKAYIAFALAANTNLLIMDEPTNGLDIPSKLQFRNIVTAAGREDKITIISTHQVRDLDDLISSIIIIDNSELLLYADKEEVSRKLFFSTGEIANKAAVIYEEQTPQGNVHITLNDHAQPSYLDLEILFNATLDKREQITNIFTT
ncbi:MAG: ABC transporter ATP-binding protein [Chitinophagaceae bacterium]